MSDVHRLLDDLTAVRRRAFDESRPEAVARQHDKAKLTARERVDALCDAGSFLEMGSLVEPARDTAFTADLDAPGDGLVTGTGLLDGRPIGLAAYDYTVLGGSNGHIGGLKQARVTQLALDHGHPLVLLLEGGGHRIQDGLDARHFAAAGNTPTGLGAFEAMAHLSGWAPMCAAVMGPGFAGPTNFSGLSR